jgi:lysozyme
VSFVYIKSTEGASVRNPYYLSDYRQARRHGIAVGAYHFFSPTSDASRQANYFLRNSRFAKGDLPPVLDVEPTPSQVRKMGGTEAMFSRIRTWLGIVRRRTGVRPILYVSQQFVNKYLPSAPDIMRDYMVWIARYGEYRPDVRLVFWQLCPDGRVSGIRGDVDINVFNGYHDSFGKFIKEETIR